MGAEFVGDAEPVRRFEYECVNDFNVIGKLLAVDWIRRDASLIGFAGLLACELCAAPFDHHSVLSSGGNASCPTLHLWTLHFRCQLKVESECGSVANCQLHLPSRYLEEGSHYFGDPAPMLLESRYMSAFRPDTLHEFLVCGVGTHDRFRNMGTVVMLVELHGEIAERIGLTTIRTTDLIDFLHFGGCESPWKYYKLR